MNSSPLLKLLNWPGILLVLMSLASRLFVFKGYAVYGDQFYTTYGEQFCLYSVWKVVHGQAVYEWPQKGWYSLSLYNWLLLLFLRLGVPAFQSGWDEHRITGQMHQHDFCGGGWKPRSNPATWRRPFRRGRPITKAACSHIKRGPC